MINITISNQAKVRLRQMAQQSSENYKRIEDNLLERIKIYVQTCDFTQEDAEEEALNDIEYLLNQ